jgi:hypothetical protein
MSINVSLKKNPTQALTSPQKATHIISQKQHTNRRVKTKPKLKHSPALQTARPEYSLHVYSIASFLALLTLMHPPPKEVKTLLSFLATHSITIIIPSSFALSQKI